MKKIIFLTTSLFFIWALPPVFASPSSGNRFTYTAVASSADTVHSRVLSLKQCLAIAWQNNRRQAVSKLQIRMAQLQHKQALSSYWPQISAQASLIRLDKDPVFLYPEEKATYHVSGFLTPMNLTVDIPPKYVKQMDRVHFSSSLGVLYPIFTGGLRSALSKQTKNAVLLATENLRKTRLELARDVKKYYYAVVLANKLYGIGLEAQKRLEVLLHLTKNLYQQGSGKVKKTDYLQTKMIVNDVRSMVARLKSNRQMADAALVNVLGLPWYSSVTPADTTIPFTATRFDLRKLVAESYSFNPDWGKLAATLKIYEGKIKEAQSHYFPQLALTGTLTHVENKYQAGIVNPRNRTLWVVGLGMRLPIFQGFRNKNQVQEARVRLEKLKQNKILLQKGIALQVKYYFLQLVQLQEQEKYLRSALEAAAENRDLHERAYQVEMATIKEVIQSQIMESLSKAQYEKILYDAMVARTNLEFIVWREVNNRLHAEEEK